MQEKGKWWKAYILILFIFTALEIGDNLISNEEFDSYYLLGTTVGVLSLIGLLGFIYQTPIFFKHMWTGVFFANLVLLSVAAYKVQNDWSEITEIIDVNEILWFYGITFAVSAPLFLALYSYTFQSSQLWSKRDV